MILNWIWSIQIAILTSNARIVRSPDQTIFAETSRNKKIRAIRSFNQFVETFSFTTWTTFEVFFVCSTTVRWKTWILHFNSIHKPPLKCLSRLKYFSFSVNLFAIFHVFMHLHNYYIFLQYVFILMFFCRFYVVVCQFITIIDFMTSEISSK